MLANRMFYKLTDKYLLATDNDFSGTTDGSFKYIGTKPYIIIPNTIKGISVTSYYQMFSENNVIKGVMSSNNNITNLGNMFQSCTSLISLELNTFETSKVTHMQAMFSGCTSLTSLDLSSFNTSNTTNLGSMFSGCTSLTSLDLSSFNTSKATITSAMFSNCLSLTSLDLSSFTVTQMVSFVMSNMFQNCTNIISAYARTQADATKLNATSNKPTTFTFVVK